MARFGSVLSAAGAMTRPGGYGSHHLTEQEGNMRTNKIIPRGLLALLGAGVIALTMASTASASPVVARAPHAYTANSRSTVLSIRPMTDGGCATDSLGEAQLCFHFVGGGTTNSAVFSVKNLGSGTLSNVHIAMTGPSSYNSQTWSIPAGKSEGFTLCPTACAWTPGTYKATLWQYTGSYENIAQYYATVS
jgi:hypothetical protein